MQEIITASEAATMPATLNFNLFDDFLSYIDRKPTTMQTYIANLKSFAAWLRYEEITQPTRADVIRYRDYLSAEHEAIRLDAEAPAGWSYQTDKNGEHIKTTLAAGTVSQYVRALKQFFSWTAAAGLYPNIAANVHAPKVARTHKRDAFTAKQVQTIENSIEHTAEERTTAAAAAAKDTAGRIERSTEQGRRLYAMFMLAVNCGLRVVELSRANIGDLQVKDGNAVLYIFGKGKDSADEKKPLSPPVYAAVKDYLNSRSDKPNKKSPLFVSTGNRSGGKRIAARTISQMLKKAFKTAGYDDTRLTAHSLRHTAANAVLEISGNNVYVTQHFLRHSSPTTTEIYLHSDNTKQETAIATQLFSYYHGEKQTDADRLNTLAQSLTPAQLQNLTAIAEAMTAG